MSIPASGPVSMSMLNTELGRSVNSSNTLLAGATTPVSPALFYLANQSSSIGINQTAPHSMSEFYSYVANLTTRVYTVVLQVGDGFGNCVNTSTTYNAEFTDNIPGAGTSFTDDGGTTVYKISGGSFLNSGSDISFGTVTTGVACNL